MPFVVRRRLRRPRFKAMASTNQSAAPEQFGSQAPTDRLTEILAQPLDVEEVDGRFEDVEGDTSSLDSDFTTFVPRTSRMARSRELPQIPDLFTRGPEIRDRLETKSSREQDKTAAEALSSLTGTAQAPDPSFEPNSYGIPRLNRERHISFLHKQLGSLPAGAVFADASRPWLLYWSLMGLSVLGEDISQYKERSVLGNTSFRDQHENGHTCGW
jgi:hypothetical protein